MDDIKNFSKSLKITEQIIEKYIDIEWDWEALFHNRNISDNFIKKNSYKFPGLTIGGIQIKNKNTNVKKDYKALTPFTNFTEIIQFPFSIWDWDWLSQNKTISFILKYNCLNWNWVMVTKRANIDIINSNLDLNWDWGFVNESMFSLENLKKYPNIKWYWKKLSKTTDVYFINEYYYLKWDWNIVTNQIYLKYKDTIVDNYLLTQCKNLKLDWKKLTSIIDLKFIEENYLFSWDNIIIQEKCDFAFIIKNMSKFNWDWYKLSSKNDIDIFFVQNYKHFNWNWKILTRKLEIDFIKNNLQIRWNWASITYKLDIDFIKQNIKFGWDLNYLSKKIDLEFIKENSNCRWDYYVLNKRFGKTLLDEIFLKPKNIQNCFNDTCLICLEDFLDCKSSLQTVLNCRHRYHTECILQCNTKKCPLCNVKFNNDINPYLKWKNKQNKLLEKV